ncbi:MAG: hypothetical protein IJW21_00945 [Clostridia bacterium]|nr:hypothetical protein [Clostridia bacterium]
MKKAAQIFLMLGIVMWMIIATPLGLLGVFMYYALGKAEKKADLNKALVISSLVLVSPVAGIIILCMKDEHFAAKGISLAKNIIVSLSAVACAAVVCCAGYMVSLYFTYNEDVEVTAQKKEIISMLEEEYGKPCFSAAWNHSDYTYTDAEGNIVSGDTREEGLMNFLFGEGALSVVYVTQDTLYLYDWVGNANTVYRADHGMTNVEKIYEFESEFHICEFLEEGLVRIRKEETCYIYNLNTGELREDGTYSDESSYHKYECSFRTPQNVQSYMLITEKASGSTRRITYKDMGVLLYRSCKVANALAEEKRVDLLTFCAHGEHVYLTCKTTDGITIFYEYDMKTNTIEYLSYIDMEQLPKTISYYPEYRYPVRD